MKKNLLFFPALLLLALITFLPGCKGLFDYLEDHRDAAPAYCRIQQFSYPLENGLSLPRDTVTFTYNAMGNPITATRPQPRTGDPDFVFRYNAHDQLTDLIGAYLINDISDSTYAESWNRYGYDQYNRIMVDTLYLFPLILHGRPTIDHYGSLVYWTFEYDMKDRVIAAHESVNGGTRNFTYSYDKDGNLAGVAHDHQVNIHRTNKIWMFLDRDYSMNNPLPNTYTYNSFGLPVKIVSPAENVGSFFSSGFEGLSYAEADIRYSCK